MGKNEENVNDIFNTFINKTIFKNKLGLQTNYTPETIPHRQDQVMQIARMLGPCLRLERPSNVFIYGLTGTGKTLSVQFVKQQLLKKAADQEVSLLMPYINCKLKKVADTEYRIMAELIKKLGGKVPSTGLPTDQIYHKFTEIIDSKKQILVIILDEVDAVVENIGDDFLYNLTRMNSELNKAQISIVGISNNLKFLDMIDPRVRSSLSEEEILFPTYNALQLQDILRNRSSEAFKEGVLAEGVIEKCAAYAAREHGDARRAIDLMRIAGELVERDKKELISLDYIDLAKSKMEADKILTSIEPMPKQHQITLYSIVELFKKARKKGEVNIFTGDVYNYYKDICFKLKIEVLTQRRISDIIGELDMFGLINAKVISKGRYGRSREIRVDWQESLAEKIDSILLSSLNL